MEDNSQNNKTRNIKKLIMSRDSFQKLVKQNGPLNKNLNKLNENYYYNMKSIFDSDEKKTQLMSYIEKLRIKDRIKQRSVSPLLIKNNNYQFSTEKVTNNKEKNPIREKSSDIIKNKNKMIRKKEKLKYDNTCNNTLYRINLNDEIFGNKNDKTNDKKDKKKIENLEKINSDKILYNFYGLDNLNKRNYYESETAPSFRIIKKKKQLQMTFTRIHFPSKKKNNNNNIKKYFKENFFFCIKTKRKRKKKEENKINLFQIENINNFSIKPKININKIDKNKLNEVKKKKDNYTGYKLVKFDKGKKINEIPFNNSIEILNKKFEEEKIKINNIPLKFNSINKYTNEIDQVENLNIISSTLKKQINLVNTGMNTIKDKRKFKEIGINVSYKIITSNSGNNTDINLVNWEKYCNNYNNDILNNNIFKNNKKINKKEKNNNNSRDSYKSKIIYESNSSSFYEDNLNIIEPSEFVIDESNN